MKAEEKFQALPSFMQLTEKESQRLRRIRYLNPPRIIKSSCTSILSIIKLAVYNPVILNWCRTNPSIQKAWQVKLVETGKSPYYNYEFKQQNWLNSFDLLAGLTLVQEASKYKQQPATRLFILFIAMEKFHSYYATCFIADKSIEILNNTKDPEKFAKILTSMTKILNEFTFKHGTAGYLFGSKFYERITILLKKTEPDRAAQVMHLCYLYLLTASNLEPHSSAEMHNASVILDEKTTLLTSISELYEIKVSSSSNLFSSLTQYYQEKFHQFTKPIQEVAIQEAKQLASKNLSANP